MKSPYERSILSAELGIELVRGEDQSPVATDERVFGATRIITLCDIHWLNDGEVVFAIRGVSAGDRPLLSNRPKADREPLSPEVLMYDHNRSKPLSGELVYYPVTPSGQIDVLRGGQLCTLQLQFVCRLGEATLGLEQETEPQSEPQMIAA